MNERTIKTIKSEREKRERKWAYKTKKRWWWDKSYLINCVSNKRIATALTSSSNYIIISKFFLNTLYFLNMRCNKKIWNIVYKFKNFSFFFFFAQEKPKKPQHDFLIAYLFHFVYNIILVCFIFEISFFFLKEKIFLKTKLLGSSKHKNVMQRINIYTFQVNLN